MPGKSLELEWDSGWIYIVLRKMNCAWLFPEFWLKKGTCSVRFFVSIPSPHRFSLFAFKSSVRYQVVTRQDEGRHPLLVVTKLRIRNLISNLNYPLTTSQTNNVFFSGRFYSSFLQGSAIIWWKMPYPIALHSLTIENWCERACLKTISCLVDRIFHKSLFSIRVERLNIDLQRLPITRDLPSSKESDKVTFWWTSIKEKPLKLFWILTRFRGNPARN